MLRIDFKPHRAALEARTSRPQKVFAMLKVAASGETAQSRPPLAFAVVIDTSGSMQHYTDQERARQLAVEQAARSGRIPDRVATGDPLYRAVRLPLASKLDYAIDAVEGILGDPRLRPDDQVTIVGFDDEAETVLRLSPVVNRAGARQALQALRQRSGGTRMAKGLLMADRQLASLGPEVVKRVVLLTDGETTDGPICRDLGRQLARGNTPVLALGVGATYNEELLRDLAATTQGSPYHLRQMEDLRPILDAEVGSLVSATMTDLTVTLNHDAGVRLEGFTRVYPAIAEVTLNGPTYRLGNADGGEPLVYVLEFTVAGLERAPGILHLAQGRLDGFAQGLRRREEYGLPELPIQLQIDYDHTAAVDGEVLGYVQQVNLDRMLWEARRLMQVDAVAAWRILEAARHLSQRVGNDPMTAEIRAAIETLRKTGTLSADVIKTLTLGGRTNTIAMDEEPGDIDSGAEPVQEGER